MNRGIQIGFVFVLALWSHCIQGQVFSKHLNIEDSTQVHVLRTVRGDTFMGHVKDIYGTRLTFLVENKISLEFDFSEIKSVIVRGEDVLVSRPLRKKKIPKGRLVGRDSFSTQNIIFTYTSFPLEKGRLLYTNFDLVWNSVDWGVTDNFTGGIALYLLNVIVLRGKLTTPVYDNIRIGVGTKFIMLFPEFDELGILTNLSGIITIGSPEKFFNLNGGIFVPTGRGVSRGYGGGIGFGGEKEKFTYRGELFILSSRLSKKAYQPVLSPELVFGFKQKHRRYEVGIILLPWTDFPVIPYLGFNAHF